MRRRKPKPYFSKPRNQWRARLRSGEQSQEQWFATKKEAQNQIDEWWICKQVGVSNDGTTLAGISKIWLDGLEVRESSIVKYQYDLRHVAPLEQLPIDRVKRRHIVDLLADISSAATRHRVRAVLSQLFAVAVDLELVRSNVVRDIRPVRHKKKPIEIFAASEIADFRKHFAKSRYLPAIEVMLEIGLRPGETYALQWSDVSDRELHVHRTMAVDRSGANRVSEFTKTNAGTRAVPLSDRMRGILRRHRKAMQAEGRADEADFVFTTQPGSNLVNMFRQSIWQPGLSEAGVPYRKPHTLRHNAASAMLNGGVPIPIVCAILGHENPSITLNTYSHLIDKETSKATDFWNAGS